MNLPDTNKVMTAGYIIAMLLILFFVYKILLGLGIVKSAAKTKAKAAVQTAINDLRGVEQFNVEYLNNKRDYKSLSGLA